MTDIMAGFRINPLESIYGNQNTSVPLASTPVSGNSYSFGYTPITDHVLSSEVVEGGSGGNWWDGFLGSTDANRIKTQGWGGLALGTLQGLGNAYMGLQQYGLAKKALQQSKEQFERNYAAQRQTTNASLEDRQRARVASNAGAYQSVGDYMDKYGIK